MSGMEAAAAGAAIGQVTKLVDVLVEPTIEKIRRWNLDRDLKRALEPTKVAEISNRYLERTLAMAASIQSVVFPQVPLQLTETYEPLLLETTPLDQKSIETLSASELAAKRVHFTIVDRAGMGKSTFSKYLTRLACEVTEKIPILYNLRHYQAAEPLTRALLKEFHEFDKEFGEKLFNALLVGGKFFIILDGFDEVSPQFQSDVRKEIEHFAVKCGGSRIVLTSRPQSNIPILAGGIRCQFKRLSTSQAHSLVKRYDKFGNLKVGERLIRQLHIVPEPLLETPLLVALLYRTFGVNNAIADRISTFYSETYEALFKGHDLTKAGFSREKECKLDIDAFRASLQLIAFHAIVQNCISWSSEQELVNFISEAMRRSRDKPGARNFANDLLTAVPLILRDGGELRFIHKTFIEYFAAEFIARSPDSKVLLYRVYQSAVWPGLGEVARFVHELSPQLARTTILAPAARAILALGVSSTWTIEETLTHGFSWKLRWGSEPDIGDFRHGSTAKTETLEARAFIDGVVAERAVSIWLSVSPKPQLGRLPPFAWKLLTASPPRVEENKDYAHARIQLSRAISAGFARGTTIELTSEQFLNLLKNKAFARFATALTATMCGGGKRSELEGRTFDEKTCADILKAEQEDAAQLAHINSILDLATE